MPKPHTQTAAKPPAITVDKALAARFAAAMHRLRAETADEAQAWDARYEALDDILENSLFLAGGYKNARAFLKVELPNEDERSVKRACQVARHFSPADEINYGVTRLDLLIEYLEAENGGPLGREKLDLDRQTIRIPDGANLRTVQFKRATSQELAAAIRAAKGAAGAIAKTAPPIVKALRAHLKKHKLAATSVRLARGKLMLGAIAPEQLPALAKALASFKFE